MNKVNWTSLDTNKINPNTTIKEVMSKLPKIDKTCKIYDGQKTLQEFIDDIYSFPDHYNSLGGFRTIVIKTGSDEYKYLSMGLLFNIYYDNNLTPDTKTTLESISKPLMIFPWDYSYKTAIEEIRNNNFEVFGFIDESTGSVKYTGCHWDYVDIDDLLIWAQFDTYRCY